jgi:hypothetical protein
VLRCIATGEGETWWLGGFGPFFVQDAPDFDPRAHLIGKMTERVEGGRVVMPHKIDSVRGRCDDRTLGYHSRGARERTSLFSSLRAGRIGDAKLADINKCGCGLRRGWTHRRLTLSNHREGRVGNGLPHRPAHSGRLDRFQQHQR